MSSVLKVNEIQHTNGTTALTVDSSGRVFQSAKPSFHAILQANQSLSADTQTTLQVKAETFITAYDKARNTGSNVGGGFDDTTYKYTIPVTGRWVIYGQLGVYNNNNPSRFMEIQFSINNAVGDDLQFIGSHSDGTSYADYDGVAGSRVLYLSAGDTVHLIGRTVLACTAMNGPTHLGGYLLA
jgi:hypothetical protein